MLLAVIVFIVPWAVTTYPQEMGSIVSYINNIGEQVASVILARNPVTVDKLKNNYNSATDSAEKNIRILIVPGHEPDFGGTEYGSLKERDMNVELAEYLKNFISQNSRFEVFVTRDRKNWSPEFAYYFKSNWSEIVEWTKAHRDEFNKLLKIGAKTKVEPAVYHVNARPDVGLRLHGINKWSNENNIDIVIHIHFNDYPRYNQNSPGEYSGFSIYVPERQYENSTTTKALAQTIFRTLDKYNAVSDLPGEDKGVVEERDLIAVGSFNSVNAASMLIEYGYIYEPQFGDKIRSVTLKELAYETYIGLLGFFEDYSGSSMSKTYDTSFLPYTWSQNIDGKDDSVHDVFALQTALILDGVYPPENYYENECPRTGKFGPCTKKSLEVFQNKYQIRGEDGFVGPKTRAILNKIYSESSN